MESLIGFSLTTNEISIVKNDVEGETFNVSPVVTRKIFKNSIDNVTVVMELRLENTDKAPFPYNIVVSVTGHFDLSNIEEKDIDSFIDVQSVQIMFPHVRSIVSSLTSIALLPPLILPIVDARKLFSNSN